MFVAYKRKWSCVPDGLDPLQLRGREREREREREIMANTVVATSTAGIFII